jgi:hypothetical protein
MALLLALLGDVAPGRSSSVSVLGIIFLVIVGIAVVLIGLGIFFTVRTARRRRRRQ